MNERIKLLASQCYSTGPMGKDGWPEYTKFNEEKFAELIVQECSKVIVNGGYWSGGPLGPKRQCTPPEIATMIKQHFGVEE
jgi:hypothetical protein